MKKVTKQAVEEFLNQNSYAFIGVSRREKHFPNELYSELKKKKFKLTPINPNMEEFQGEKCYPDINSIPEKVDAAILTTPKAETLKVLQQVQESGIKHVWVQQGAHTQEVLEYADNQDINIIAKKCLFMFTEPESIHKFHHNFNKFFGLLPK